MEYQLDAGGQQRLERFFDRVGDVLGKEQRRSSFAMYAFGLFGEGERKSMEPIAARACGDPEQADAIHQRVQHFVSHSAWNDHSVRRVASSYVTSAMTAREPIVAWIIDDTGFLKQGKHSVGVQRQYTGSAGKIANCQIGVSLSIATATEHAPIDFELYLPQDWIDDPTRRKKARIPSDIAFKTKPELALEMIERAVSEGVPLGTVLADSAYGDNSEFRRQLRCLGLEFAVEIHAPTQVWRLDSLNRRIGDPVAVGDLAVALGPDSYRRTNWRQGTKRKLSARFAMERVVVAHDDGVDPSQREDVALLMEWTDGDPAPAKFFLATVPPSMSRKALIRLIKQRWCAERVYEDLKGELGLDHFEGRSFVGWHHHVSVALCCFAFIVADRLRASPPSARNENRHRPHRSPSRAPLPRFFHHRSPRYSQGLGHLAPPMSVMPSLSDTAFCTCGAPDAGGVGQPRFFRTLLGK